MQYHAMFIWSIMAAPVSVAGIDRLANDVIHATATAPS